MPVERKKIVVATRPPIAPPSHTRSRLFIASFFSVILFLLVGMKAAGFAREKWANDFSEYSAVYLTTGDIYYGKYEGYFRPRLRDVWYLQREAASGTEPEVSIVPFKDVFWKPSDTLYLNQEQIIWRTPLLNSSQLVRAFRNGK